MDEDEISRLLSECKCKIWEDKKRLILTKDKQFSPQSTSVLPSDVRYTKKEDLIEKLNSSPTFVGLGEKQITKKHSPNFTSVPEDVRAIKKEALISKLSSPEGLSGLGERKKRSFCRATSPLPEDVREIKKDELISKFCIGEELLHLGRQPEKVNIYF
ncbi:hypothetical protein C0J52_22035 [Blattella germanica]|nr:hypothetical protein C0J52_22035 [Blattella germanica]